MRVSELIAELQKMPSSSRVMMAVASDEFGKLREPNFIFHECNTCIIRDHVITRRKETVMIHGVEFEVIR